MGGQTDGPDSRSLVGGEHSFGMERPQMIARGTEYQALVSRQSSGLLVSRNNDNCARNAHRIHGGLRNPL